MTWETSEMGQKGETVKPSWEGDERRIEPEIIMKLLR